MNEEVRRLFRELYKICGENQREVARCTGLSATEVNRMVSGKGAKEPRQATWDALQHALARKHLTRNIGAHETRFRVGSPIKPKRDEMDVLSDRVRTLPPEKAAKLKLILGTLLEEFEGQAT